MSEVVDESASFSLKKSIRLYPFLLIVIGIIAFYVYQGLTYFFGHAVVGILRLYVTNNVYDVPEYLDVSRFYSNSILSFSIVTLSFFLVMAGVVSLLYSFFQYFLATISNWMLDRGSSLSQGAGVLKYLSTSIYYKSLSVFIIVLIILNMFFASLAPNLSALYTENELYTAGGDIRLSAPTYQLPINNNLQANTSHDFESFSISLTEENIDTILNLANIDGITGYAESVITFSSSRSESPVFTFALYSPLVGNNLDALYWQETYGNLSIFKDLTDDELAIHYPSAAQLSAPGLIAGNYLTTRSALNLDDPDTPFNPYTLINAIYERFELNISSPQDNNTDTYDISRRFSLLPGAIQIINAGISDGVKLVNSPKLYDSDRFPSASDRTLLAAFSTTQTRNTLFSNILNDYTGYIGDMSFSNHYFIRLQDSNEWNSSLENIHSFIEDNNNLDPLFVFSPWESLSSEFSLMSYSFTIFWILFSLSFFSLLVVHIFILLRILKEKEKEKDAGLYHLFNVKKSKIYQNILSKLALFYLFILSLGIGIGFFFNNYVHTLLVSQPSDVRFRTFLLILPGTGSSYPLILLSTLFILYISFLILSSFLVIFFLTKRKNTDKLSD